MGFLSIEKLPFYQKGGNKKQCWSQIHSLSSSSSKPSFAFILFILLFRVTLLFFILVVLFAICSEPQTLLTSFWTFFALCELRTFLKLLQTFLLINSLTPKWYVSHLFLFLYKYIKIVLVIPNVRESNRQTWCSS